MRSRWRGTRIFLVTFLLIAGLACGRYELSVDPAAPSQAVGWLQAHLPGR
ncbi:MAG: hypothetical protein FWF90_02045 [Promicromonosporaceae bacterium]|nr:hypothetical protein [Promicromonosporaceae bacterium]